MSDPALPRAGQHHPRRGSKSSQTPQVRGNQAESSTVPSSSAGLIPRGLGQAGLQETWKSDQLSYRSRPNVPFTSPATVTPDAKAPGVEDSLPLATLETEQLGPIAEQYTTEKRVVPRSLTTKSQYQAPQAQQEDAKDSGGKAAAELDTVLDRIFQVQPKKTAQRFFAIGRVFMTLWSEPASPGSPDNASISTVTFNERAHTKVRRFVVIREGSNSCSAIPISTYGRRGLTKRAVKKSDHGIIYSSNKPPAATIEEMIDSKDLMQPIAIRIRLDSLEKGLDWRSRVDYRKVHTIEHNLKVVSIGTVDVMSMAALLDQFNVVFNTGSALGTTSA